jgi:hypothetical protein
MLAMLGRVRVMMLSANRLPAPAYLLHYLSRFHLRFLSRSAGDKPEPRARLRHVSVAHCDVSATAKRSQCLTVALSADRLWRSLTKLHLSAVVRTGHRVLILEGHRTSLVVVIGPFA